MYRASTFKPNQEIYKEYPQAFDGMRVICALHEFADSDVWLLKFDASDGEWKRVREATKADKEFFKWNAFPTTANEVAFAEDMDAS